MKTADDMRLYLEEVINDVYPRPHMYGPSAVEIDIRLEMLHWLWAQLTGRFEEMWEFRLQMTPDGYRSVAGSFHRVFDLIHDVHGEEQENERVKYVVGMWKAISDRMGITQGNTDVLTRAAEEEPQCGGMD